jgi:hypothetical protein
MNTLIGKYQSQLSIVSREYVNRLRNSLAEINAATAPNDFSGYEDDGRGLADLKKLETADFVAAQKLEDAALLRSQAIAEQVGSSFAYMFGSIVLGQQSAGQAFQSLTASLVQMLIEMGMAQLVAHMFAKPAKIAEATSQAGLVGAGTAAALATNPLTALAAIPAGLAAQATALAAFVPVAAASRGFDVGNYNPVTQLHAREMVLPATLADRVRNMTDAPGNATSIQLTINAVDGKSVERLFNDNQGALIRTLQTAVRNGRA